MLLPNKKDTTNILKVFQLYISIWRLLWLIWFLHNYCSSFKPYSHCIGPTTIDLETSDYRPQTPKKGRKDPFYGKSWSKRSLEEDHQEY